MRKINRHLLLSSLCAIVTLTITALTSADGLSRPELTTIKVPKTAVVNQPIIVQVTVKNGGADAKAGGISISVSDNPQVGINYTNTVKARVYPVGSKIWSKKEKKSIASKYILFEAWQEPWKANESHRVSIRIIPSKVGTLRVFVRATVTATGAERRIIATPESGPVDQQGFAAKAYAISVKAESAPVRKRVKPVSNPITPYAKQIEKDIKEIYTNYTLADIRFVKGILDFNNDGLDDIALTSSLLWGNAGTDWEIYLGNEVGNYTYFMNLFFHPLGISVEPLKKGTAKIFIYRRLGAGEGYLSEFHLSRTGTNTVATKRIGLGGATGLKELDRIFGYLDKEYFAEFCKLSDYLADKNCDWMPGYHD
jgi:hypothetical protein